MNSYANETYGERAAEVYDNWFSDYDRECITALTEFARGGRALELGIGTGRIALPLAAAGVEVHGIDAAPSMVRRLRAKPGGEQLPVHMGDFAEVAADGEFTLIYIVFNTFFALFSQDDQVKCFRNVANHLTIDGSFVIEAFVPDLTRFTGRQVNWATNVTTDRVELDVGQHDSAAQRVMSQKVIISEGDVRLYPVQIRYAWPSELDLMAQLAGMRLRERWGSWKRETFTSQSQKHVSIYQRHS
jgi:SAM-dependent methyltransferase